jgi:hypothetical protein
MPGPAFLNMDKGLVSHKDSHSDFFGQVRYKPVESAVRLKTPALIPPEMSYIEIRIIFQLPVGYLISNACRN